MNKSGLWRAAFAAAFVLVMVSGQTAAQEPQRAWIGHLPITDHAIAGVARELSAESLRHVIIETLRFADYATLSESLRSGSLTGAFILAPLAFQLKAKHVDIKLVLYGHRDGSAIVVRTNQAISSTDALRGKTIAVPSRFSTVNMLLHLHVTRAGLSYSNDLRVVDMPPPEMPAALAQDTIDGFITAEPLVSKAELSGAGRILVRSSEIWEHHPCCVFVLSGVWAEAHPEAAYELVRVLMEAGIYIEAHRLEAANIAARSLGFAENLLEHALVGQPPARVTFRRLTPEISELDRMQSYMHDVMKLIEQPVDLNELVERKFALAAEAYLQRRGQDQ